MNDIQQAVAERAKSLGMTAYSIAVATGGGVSPDTVKRFLEGRWNISSDKLALVCEVIRLHLRPSNRR